MHGSPQIGSPFAVISEPRLVSCVTSRYEALVQNQLVDVAESRAGEAASQEACDVRTRD
jgi:hypothetical protein